MPVLLTPPPLLLEPCNEPVEHPEVLRLLREGNRDDAAAHYVQYVLGVRDAFQLCNGRLDALRQWWLEGGEVNE